MTKMTRILANKSLHLPLPRKHKFCAVLLGLFVFFVNTNVYAEAIISSTGSITINNSQAAEGGGIYFDGYSLRNEGTLTLTNNKSEVTCPANTHWDGSACACNAGYVPNDSADGCRINCTNGTIWNGTACVCPSGQNWNGSTCISCPSGTYWDAGWNACICPYGYAWSSSNICVGYNYDEKGIGSCSAYTGSGCVTCGSYVSTTCDKDHCWNTGIYNYGGTTNDGCYACSYTDPDGKTSSCTYFSRKVQ